MREIFISHRREDSLDAIGLDRFVQCRLGGRRPGGLPFVFFTGDAAIVGEASNYSSGTERYMRAAKEWIQLERSQSLSYNPIGSSSAEVSYVTNSAGEGLVS